jgi:hypothetical protein
VSRNLHEITRLHERVMQVQAKVTARLPNGATYTVLSPGSATGCASAIANGAGLYGHTGPRPTK